MIYKTTICILLAIMLVWCSCTKPEPLTSRSNTLRLEIAPYNQSGGAVTSPLLPIMQQAVAVQNECEIAKAVNISTLDSAFVARIFEDVRSQGYTLWGRYFKDGQYAYANNIRRYIENKYRVATGKLFLFGNLTARSPHHSCCASWKYDVAVVLRGQNNVVYVIDPRLFTSVVRSDVWTSFHISPTSCDLQPSKTPQSKLVSGESFVPLDSIHSQYLIDRDYSYTNAMLAYYADSSCNCLLF